MALTIRAAAAARPVLRLAPQSAKDTRPLIDTDSPLILEGLVLQRQVEGNGDPGHPERNAIIYSWRAPVRMANCRLLGGKRCVGLWLNESPACELRNCEFLGEDFHCAVDWNPPREDGKLILENCLLFTGPHGIVFHQKQPIKGAVSLKLARCTLCAAEPLNYWCWAPWGQLFSETALVPMRLEASDTVFAAGSHLLNFKQVDQPDPLLGRKVEDAFAKAGRAMVVHGGFPEEVESSQAALPLLVSWHGKRNLYSGRFLLLSSIGSKNPWKAAYETPPHDLPGWQQYWNGADESGTTGQVVFQSKVQEIPRAGAARLTPLDFRLKPASPGTKASANGRDLGIDADLLGPGSAYERWKKTAEYKQWLKDTRQK
jgi:hypothetical protein